MKKIKWKNLISTCIICLLPVLPGLALWDKLPDAIAVHFDIHNMPDGFASKGFAVFCLPLIMSLLQIGVCIVNDLNIGRKKENAPKWVIPSLAIVVQTMILCYAMGMNVDIRRIVTVIIALWFFVIGKLQIKYAFSYGNASHSAEGRIINRVSAGITIVMAVMALATLFMPPESLFVWLLLLIPYGVIEMFCNSKSKTEKNAED